MKIRVPRPQTDYDRALDLLRWENLGRPGWRELPPILKCRAMAQTGMQCKMLAVHPEAHPIYCKVHQRMFLDIVSDEGFA